MKSYQTLLCSKTYVISTASSIITLAALAALCCTATRVQTLALKSFWAGFRV